MERSFKKLKGSGLIKGLREAVFVKSCEMKGGGSGVRWKLSGHFKS